MNLEQSAGSLQYPGETTPTLQVVARSSEEVVGSVTRDEVAWSYTYTNLRRGVRPTATSTIACG